MFTRLRDLREDHDLKQETLAAELGIRQTTYSKYELGKIAGDMGADILDGKSKPENMAIRYQQQFKAMVNAKTAKEIGIQIPDSVKSKAEIIQ